MQEAINRAIKLIERKQAFILNVESPRAKDAIAAEINIINGLIFQLQEQQHTAKHLEEINQRNANADTAIIKKLYMLCVLHGIDIGEWIYISNELIKHELETDKKEGIIRVPTKLREKFYNLYQLLQIPDEQIFLPKSDLTEFQQLEK